MDGVGAAASIVSIATAGIQISIKLITLASQISTASERISSIGNDVSLTSGVLQQLGELMTQKATDDENGISIFSQGGLETTRSSASMCQTIFEEIDKATKLASEQLRGKGRFTGGKIKLSRTEKAKWPFLQPSIETLRIDLREAKGTLVLMLQVTTLAFSKRMAELNNSGYMKLNEQRDMVYAILAIQKEQKEQQGNTDTSKRERRSSKPSQNDITLPATKGLSIFSHMSSDPIFSNSISTIPRYQDAFKPDVSMAVSSQEPHDQYTAMRDAKTKLPNCQTPPDGLKNRLVDLKAGQPTANESMSTPTGSSSEVFQYFSTSKMNTPLLNPSKCGSGARSKEAGDSGKMEEKKLDLFLFKPIIQDVLDVIQLSWTLRHVKTSQDEIREQLARNEHERIPAIREIKESLYPHEHKVIDHAISAAGPGASLASIKRTKVDIRHRDILFQGIPGLQFTVLGQKYSGALDTGYESVTLDNIKVKMQNPRLETAILEPSEEYYESSDDMLAKEGTGEAEIKFLISSSMPGFSSRNYFYFDSSDSSPLTDFMTSNMVRTAVQGLHRGGEVDLQSETPERQTPSTESRISNQPNPIEAEILTFTGENHDSLREMWPRLMKERNIEGGNWQNYSLFIIIDDHERLVRLEEWPVLLAQLLHSEGRKVVFELRWNHTLLPSSDSDDRRCVSTSSVSEDQCAFGSLGAQDKQSPVISGIGIRTEPSLQMQNKLRIAEKVSRRGLLIDTHNMVPEGISTCDQEDTDLETSDSEGCYDSEVERNRMQEVIDDLLGKYTTLFEPQQKAKSISEATFPGGVQ